MATRYVDGISGNNSWDGSSPVFVSGTTGPKATLNGTEDIPVAAGDLVHVRPATYRETLTVDVSGSSGNPIEYRGDYAGLIWPNPGRNVARITGSDNDQSTTRTNCITATSKDYRIFKGFVLDGSTGRIITATTCSNWIIDSCYFTPGTNILCDFIGTGTQNTIQNCFLLGYANAGLLQFTHSSTVSSAGHLVQNCIFLGGTAGVQSVRVGGFTVKNSIFIRPSAGVVVSTALAGGQTITVNDCIIFGCGTGLNATAVGEITEDYNNLYACGTNRTNTNAGANSNTYLFVLDARWFFEQAVLNRRVLTPFDLASYSQLINVAGTSPSSTDLRGNSQIGSQREWGALEYDVRVNPGIVRP